ncbi:MAG TPA: DUF3108 domain-containing protein [Pyrinomonadaceae bacterium]|nr:DUF3108 domain-containing protein [Pyrinomonadaceae bacterium]
MNLSLKPRFIAIPVLLFFAFIFPVLAQEKEAATPLAFSQSPYRIGERLTYNVSFSNFPSAAHVEVEIASRGNFFGRDAIQLRGHVETTGVINVALYAINNDYVTYVDPSTGLPFRSEETARDAIKSADSVQDFNQTAGNGAIPPNQKGFAGTYDFLSAFYRARALPLNEGAVYNFSVHSEATNYEAELRVSGKDVIRTNVGSFTTVVTQVRISNSAVRNLKVYFSDDERHVPVLLTARVSAGELRAELAGSELVTPPTATPAPTPAIVVAPVPTPIAPATLGPNVPFEIGEQLNYQVFIGANNTPMGIASFQVRGRSRYFERDGVFLSVNAQTTGAAARVFVAKDQIETYVDPKGLLPYRTVMNLLEGQRRLNQTLTWNQDNGIATTDRGKSIEIPVGTHDYLSFFYLLRTFNLNPPKRNAIAVLVENDPKTLYVEAQKRETIQLGNRAVPAIALSLTTSDPQPDKFQIRMWVSDDRRRLPLRLTCMTELGPLRADLAILPTASQ